MCVCIPLGDYHAKWENSATPPDHDDQAEPAK